MIQQELGDPEIKVVYIGPAGENLVRFACLITEVAGAAARGGLGAVMGSKNIKAVAVRGNKSVQIARPAEMLEASLALNREIRESPACQELSTYGVVRFVAMMYQLSFFPVGYFEEVHREEIIETYGGPAYYEFRAYKGTALMQAVGHRGDPLPLRGSLLEFDWHNAPEWFQETAEKMYGKAVSTIMSEHNNLAIDSMEVCTWPYSLFIFHTIDKAAHLFNLVTGKDWDVDHILGIAERLRNAERMFDVRRGLNRETYNLPKKFFEKPLSKGKYEGAGLDKNKFEAMKDEYYMLRGWDKETGAPTKEKLCALGLPDMA